MRKKTFLLPGIILLFLMSSCQSSVGFTRLTENNGRVRIENRTDRTAVIEYQQEFRDSDRIFTRRSSVVLEDNEFIQLRIYRFINSGSITVTVDGVERDIDIFMPSSSGTAQLRLSPRDFDLPPIIKPTGIAYDRNEREYRHANYTGVAFPSVSVAFFNQL